MTAPNHAWLARSTLVALLALAGCATNTDPTLRTGGTATIVNPGRGGGVFIDGEDNFTAPTVIEAPIDQVWDALLKTFPAVGVPVDAIQTASYTIGTPVTNARRDFAGKPISTYLTCGGSAGVAEVADAYSVSIGVLASLAPVANGTQLQVRVSGSAKDPYTSVPARNCISKGRLEAEIDSTLRAILEKQYGPPS